MVRNPKETDQRRREAEVVAELARDMNAPLDLDTVLQRVAAGAEELCGSDIASIALRDPGSEAMVIRYMVGARYQGYEAVRIWPGEGIGGQVLVTGRPLRTDHYAEDPRISSQHLGVIQGEEIVSAMAVPIHIGDRVEGVIYVATRAPRPFTDRDEAILVRLADHAAIAIRNVHLFAREQEARALAEASARSSRGLMPSSGRRTR